MKYNIYIFELGSYPEDRLKCYRINPNRRTSESSDIDQRQDNDPSEGGDDDDRPLLRQHRRDSSGSNMDPTEGGQRTHGGKQYRTF